MLLKQTGGFEVLELEDRGPTELKGWVRARDSDALMAVSFLRGVRAAASHFDVPFRPGERRQSSISGEAQ